MKKIIIILVICGIIWFIHSINPTIEDHMDLIDPELSYESAVWDDLEYKDYFVASFTGSRKKGSMVTFGLCKYVKLVDEEWLAKQRPTKQEE